MMGKFEGYSWMRRTALALLACLWVLAAALGVKARENGEPTADWKPRIHFFAGPLWNNDPNGPILINGVYNLYYQDNPYGDKWGHMSWGHAVSRDLIHWQKLPVALPEGDGTMIFSGSVVRDARNTSGFCGEPRKDAPACLVAIYTGDTPPAPGNAGAANKERQNQNVAFSRDAGVTWTKYSGNPVLDLMQSSFRDPKVFWHEPSHSWVMAAVLSDEHRVKFFPFARL